MEVVCQHGGSTRYGKSSGGSNREFKVSRLPSKLRTAFANP